MAKSDAEHYGVLKTLVNRSHGLLRTIVDENQHAVLPLKMGMQMNALGLSMDELKRYVEEAMVPKAK